jgi:hypothetical protein
MKFGNGEAWQEAWMVGEMNERGGDGEDKSRHISKVKHLVFLQCCVHVPSFKGHNFLFLVLFRSMKRLQTFPLHTRVDN